MFEGKKDLLVALETLVDGGSVSLLGDGVLIAESLGDRDLSRSEDILPSIEELLKKADVRRTGIGLVAVADGPGSVTGKRIGRATAKGLARAFGAEYMEIGIFEALWRQGGRNARGMGAIYSRRKGVYFKEYGSEGAERRQIDSIESFTGAEEFAGRLEELRKAGAVFAVSRDLGIVLENFEKVWEKIHEGVWVAPWSLATVAGMEAACRWERNGN